MYTAQFSPYLGIPVQSSPSKTAQIGVLWPSIALYSNSV